jgi:hypothetical protein
MRKRMGRASESGTVRVILIAASITLASDVTAYPDPCTHETAKLTGTILDIDGIPARNAKVSWYGMEWHADCRGATGQRFDTQTDSAGEYLLEVPATRGSLSVETRDRLGPAREIVFLEQDSRGDSRHDYRFRIFRVEGHVIGPGGAPLEQGRVIYYPDPGGAMICGTGLPETSILKGTFSAILRRAGLYVFGIAPSPGDAGICSVSRRITIGRDTTITISLDGHVVEGTVRRRDGQALAHARVGASGRGIGTADTTDTAGRYRMYLPEGTYKWEVIPRERWIQPRSFGWDSISGPYGRDFEIGGVEWWGRVVNAATGEPIDSIRISGYSVSRDSPRGDGISALSGPEGRFHFVMGAGSTFDLLLKDYRVGPVRHRVDEDPKAQEERVEREYARVRSRWILGLTAARDSTFDIRMDPP